MYETPEPAAAGKSGGVVRFLAVVAVLTILLVVANLIVNVLFGRAVSHGEASSFFIAGYFGGIFAEAIKE